MRIRRPKGRPSRIILSKAETATYLAQGREKAAKGDMYEVVRMTAAAEMSIRPFDRVALYGRRQDGSEYFLTIYRIDRGSA